jgi:hypothetical protein
MVAVYSGPDAESQDFTRTFSTGLSTLMYRGLTYRVNSILENNVFLNSYKPGDTVLSWSFPSGIALNLGKPNGVSVTSNTGGLTYWVDLDQLKLNPSWHSFGYVLSHVVPTIQSALFVGTPNHPLLKLLAGVLIIYDPGTTDLLVTAPDGTQTGMTADGKVVEDIPGSVYFPSIPLVMIATPLPGPYKVSVHGRVSGSYILETSVGGFSQTDAPVQTSTGTLAQGQRALYSVTLGAADTTIQTRPISNVPPPPVTPPPPPSGSGFGAGRDAFVTTLYRDILGRAPEALGLRFWSGVLAAGVRPSVVAVAIWDSAEHRRLLRLRLAPHFPLAAAYADALQAAAVEK